MITDLYGYQKILQNFGKPISSYMLIIIKVLRQDNTYPYEDYHRTNSKNPQAALMSMLSWWKDQSVPPSQ
jgi:hypothetical protein